MRCSRVVFLATVLVAPCWTLPLSAQMSTPRITGPIPSPATPGDPSRNYPFFTTSDIAAKHDYVEEEFFIEGLATRYVRDGERTATIATDGPHPYKTRVIVRRPILPSRFNGTVILEWTNVVPIRQWDFETDWNITNEHLMRRGYVHVGATVQQLAIHSPTGLKAWNPSRYSSLDVTAGGALVSDELSVAIFSQIAQTLRNAAGSRLLGTLRPRNVIATGQSASAGQLRTYYNSIHPHSGAVDGFVLHGAGQSLRPDLRAPVFKIMAENDVIRVQAAIRQPDSDYLRTWEVAGTSHLDVDIVRAHLQLRDRDKPHLNQPESPGCGPLQPSRVPARLVQDAVYDWMKRWIEGTAQPPRAPPIEMTSIVQPGIGPEGFSVVRRDEQGNALGGIRLATFAVPVATNSGANDLPGQCFTYGSWIPFDSATVTRLYRTRAAYLDQVNRVADENLRAGFVTPEGAEQMKRDAAAWRWPGVR